MPYAVCRRPATEHQQSRDREGAGRQLEGVIENRREMRINTIGINWITVF
ncbi:MAG: hypothetical protein ACR2L2_18880 [Acidobacteriota bacterium]